MIAGRNEPEETFLGAKKESDIQARPTFEIVLAEATDA